MTHPAPAQSQIDKFKTAAKELETDDDPARFEERLRGIVKHKPVPEARMNSKLLNAAVPCVVGGICGGFHLSLLQSALLGAAVGLAWVGVELVARQRKPVPEKPE